ncbi:PilZ domain-containing protein [Vibrio crassostreae]|uniref:PilZ domain-containing protein n=1 Tax=Vibrio crassostreae TaxID=246167 RepID=UPI001B30E2EB|nr:PilZ domain-containing protein [Vibrio crassostreae]
MDLEQQKIEKLRSRNENRRIEKRHEITAKHKATVNSDADSLFSLFTGPTILQVKDVSSSGACLKSKKEVKFSLGTHVKIKFTTLKFEIKKPATVMWVTPPMESGEILLGVKLSEPFTREEIALFL